MSSDKWKGISKTADKYDHPGAVKDFRKAMIAGVMLARGDHASCFYRFDGNMESLVRKIRKGDLDERS